MVINSSRSFRCYQKKAGLAPFKELGKKGILSLGQAVLTSSGKLNYKAIIHVAGINLFWTATETSIRASTLNAINLAEINGFKSIAFPLIGAGTGRYNREKVLEIMTQELNKMNSTMKIVIVVKI
ncbi:MAG: macro domain-containing protein [Leptospiraceae bacterium]|nr:macro domain-containing protein [Leptospiraceae bacterium]